MCDVKAKKMTSTGAMSVGSARIKTLHYLPVASGNITIKDGGASGTTVLDVDISASSGGTFEIGGNGIRCSGDPYVTLTAVTSVTVVYG